MIRSWCRLHGIDGLAFRSFALLCCKPFSAYHCSTCLGGSGSLSTMRIACSYSDMGSCDITPFEQCHFSRKGSCANLTSVDKRLDMMRTDLMMAVLTDHHD